MQDEYELIQTHMIDPNAKPIREDLAKIAAAYRAQMSIGNEKALDSRADNIPVYHHDSLDLIPHGDLRSEEECFGDAGYMVSVFYKYRFEYFTRFQITRDGITFRPTS